MSRREIAAVNQAFEDAARKRDTDRLAALYTRDAIVMPPDAPFVKGRENIKQLWGSAIQQMGLKDVRLNTHEADALCPLELQMTVARRELTGSRQGARLTALSDLHWL